MSTQLDNVEEQLREKDTELKGSYSLYGFLVLLAF